MNHLDFVMNGELYVKRGPDIFDATSDIEYFNGIITDIEFDISKEEPDFSREPYLDEFKSFRDAMIEGDGALSYSGTDSFWQLFTSDGANLKLVQCEQLEFSRAVKTYNSRKDLDKDFIKLSQFLSEATFVGKKFKRTKPIKDYNGDYDTGYMTISCDDSYYIALFCTKDLFLVKSIDPYLGEYYKLINSRYTLDGNYKFFGPVYEKYRDKNKVYAEILQQVTQYNKGQERK